MCRARSRTTANAQGPSPSMERVLKTYIIRHSSRWQFEVGFVKSQRLSTVMIVGLTTETEVTTTYKAYEITSPGQFTQVVRPLVEPGPGQVRLRVEACGVCHTDSATVDGQFPGLAFPRVPGHE